MATSKNTKNMTPAQRNANTWKNVSSSFAGPKKTTKSPTKGKTSAKPQSKGFVDKANDFIDWAFRDNANKKVGEVNKSVQKKLDSTKKTVGDVNKKVQKNLDPYRKKAADLNKSVQKKLDPVRDALYGKDKKEKAPAGKTPAKSDTKKPVTVVNAKGKTVYDPNKRTITTYNKKGKTVEDKKRDFTTTYNKKGSTVTIGGLPDTSVVQNKKGKTVNYSNGSVATYNKKGAQAKNKDGSVTTKNSKGITTTPPAKKATNSPEVKVTPPSNNKSIEQKAKDAMSGKYGTGAARKTTLGADYDKVQAIINKKATTTKAKPTGPSKGTLALIEKNVKDEQEGRLKFDEPVASVSTKSTEVKPEVKPTAADVDKSIDAAMKGIAKSKIMKKGGTVKMKYGGTPFSTPVKKISGTAPVRKPIPLYTGQKSNSTTKKVVDSGNQNIGKKPVAAQKKYGGVIKSKRK